RTHRCWVSGARKKKAVKPNTFDSFRSRKVPRSKMNEQPFLGVLQDFAKWCTFTCIARIATSGSAMARLYFIIFVTMVSAFVWISINAGLHYGMFPSTMEHSTTRWNMLVHFFMLSHTDARNIHFHASLHSSRTLPESPT
ncbi:hypothetical protein PENTCL1PPCAC_9004, partial [Pristionchus entomophagus]